MLIILLSVVFIILFLQTFFLGGAVLPGIAGLLLCAAGIVSLILLKKQGRRCFGIISASAGLILSVVCCIFITSGAGTGTLQQKETLLKKIVSTKTVQTAEEKYNAYIETYGEDDSSALCLAKYYMKADEADKSRSMLFKLKNKTSIDYYRTMTEWYNKFDKGNFSYVVSTLLDAVAEHPSWAKGHLMLGLSYYENGDNTSAIYYLKKAQLLDPSDGYSLCYLGVISYDRGSYKAAQEYLKRAGKAAKKDKYLTELIETYQECVAREAA